MKDTTFFVQASTPLSSRPETAVQTTASEIADIYRWAYEQAAHIRAAHFDLVDRVNVADEIEDVGRRESDALVSNLEIVLTHILKWDHQPQKRSHSWESSIGEHRDRVTDRLKDSPSMNANREAMTSRAYRYARRRASRETKLALPTFPETCAYSWSEIMEKPFELDRT